MDLIKIASEHFLKSLQDKGGQVSPPAASGAPAEEGGDVIGVVMRAVKALMADGDGKIDLQDIINAFTQAGVASAVSSWLGNGGNEGISKDVLKNVFGDQKLQRFSDQLGVQKETAEESLTDAIPAMIDNASQDGQLLDNAKNILGGLGGLFGGKGI